MSFGRPRVWLTGAVTAIVAVASVTTAGSAQAATGCRVAFGIGEAPLRRQGTVSLWSSAAAMTTFAYGAPHHRAAITATPDERWYVEELFTRFAVVEASGSIDGVAL